MKKAFNQLATILLTFGVKEYMIEYLESDLLTIEKKLVKLINRINDINKPDKYKNSQEYETNEIIDDIRQFISQITSKTLVKATTNIVKYKYLTAF